MFGNTQYLNTLAPSQQLQQPKLFTISQPPVAAPPVTPAAPPSEWRPLTRLLGALALMGLGALIATTVFLVMRNQTNSSSTATTVSPTSSVPAATITPAPNVCDPTCRNGGSCVNGACECGPLYNGVDCGSSACIPNCVQSQGTCQAGGICKCNTGFTGIACDVSVCPTTCTTKICNAEGACDCGSTGRVGRNCDLDPCGAVTCQNGGTCAAGICNCVAGYSGYRCEKSDCPNDCSSGNGVCNSDGTCTCNSGFLAPDCYFNQNFCTSNADCPGSTCDTATMRCM